MVIIYDFDGTLTQYSLPQYEILKRCGYTDELLMKRIHQEIKKGTATGLYDAYYKCYQDILLENNVALTKDNICLGSDKVQFNSGVIDYFQKFQVKDIKHFIVTSGIQDYVEATPIKHYVNGIYGVQFGQKDGTFEGVKFLLTDEKKVEVIKQIQEICGTNSVIYCGDGLTDKFAFEYVHQIGGTSIFIGSEETYKKLNTDGIIDQYFEADFSCDSPFRKFIEHQISIERSECR